MTPGVTLYFIRHGQTEWNRTRRIQGQIDTPLNDTGRAQAARNGRMLAELGLDLPQFSFISSPLERCRETMEIVRRTAGLQPDDYATDDRLKEIHFGHWQRQTWPETPAFDPDGHKARLADPFNWRPRQGESYADLTTRVGAWSDDLTQDTVCVAHGGVSRALRGHLLNLPPSEVPELSVPQDKILKLKAGEMSWI